MHSIRTKILAITLVFLSFLSVSFVLYSVATTARYKLLRLEDIEKTVEIEAEKVNKTIAHFERGAADLVVAAMLFYQSQMTSIGETSVLEYLRGFPAAAGGGFWFEPYAFNADTLRASIYAYFDKDTGELRLGDIEDYNHFNKNWYREIFDGITQPYQVAWAKPFVGDISLTLKTTAGSVIYDHEGNMIGVSVLDWGIQETVRELSSVRPTKNSFVLLCVPDKDYVISDTHTNSLIGASLEKIPWDINADSFTLDGIQYLSFSRLLENGWLLAVQIPLNEIFAEVESQNNRFTLIIAISLLVMIILVYCLVSKFINTPIKQFTFDISHLALGNLDHHIKVKSKDELGIMAKAFNTMTENLKNSIEAHDREREEKEKMAVELSVAAEIQVNMLPCIFPAFPDRSEFDIYASMLPAKAVGGDFYDFYMLDENNLAIIIADVSGKGIPAALFMVIAKTMIRDCSTGKSPINVFDEVNKKLCENNDSGMFVTAFMGFYNIPTGRFIYVNAGHTPPLIRKSKDEFHFLRTKPHIVLGFTENAEYEEEEIILEPGDIIYLYTDGVTEALNSNKELFAEARLLEAANKYRHYPPRGLLSAIKQEIDTFADGAEQSDDITMLALEVNNPDDAMGKLTGPMKELTVDANEANLKEVLDFVEAELKKNNCPQDIHNEIDQAVEEIFVNISNYAYKPESGKATIGIVPVGSGDEILIRFEDSGKPYNPVDEADPNFNISIMEREIGGLGVFMVKNLMDKVYYVRRENKNFLTITRKIK